MSNSKQSKMVHVGTISGAHGIKGEIKLRSFTAKPKAIADYQPLSDAKNTREFRFTIIGVVKDQLIAKVEGINDRNAAELLRQTELYAPRERIPSPQHEDEVLLEDLIGLQARLSDGSIYGNILAVMNYGAGDIVEIAPAKGGKTELYSFTLANFPDIFLDEGYLLFSPPEISDATREKD